MIRAGAARRPVANSLKAAFPTSEASVSSPSGAPPRGEGPSGASASVVVVVVVCSTPRLSR